MTETEQHQDQPQDINVKTSLDSSEPPPASAKPTSDSNSDNDTSDKPVREKLEKTSLATMSKHAASPLPVGGEIEMNPMATPEISQALLLTNTHESTTKEEPRGRPVKKRSFDDLETPERDHPAAKDWQPESSNGHVRKRSRDVRSWDFPKGDSRLQNAEEAPLHEEVDGKEKTTKENYRNGVLDKKKSNLSTPMEGCGISLQLKDEEKDLEKDAERSVSGPSEAVDSKIDSENGKDVGDQDMQDPTSTPRKKRSRDEFDTEADREQKIVATEEARAQRRSDELDRADVSCLGEDVTEPFEDSAAVKGPASAAEVLEKRESEQVDQVERPKSAFGSISTIAPRTEPQTGATNQQTQTSSTPFASSGFGILSDSSISPFCNLATASGTTTTSPFASAASSITRSLDLDMSADKLTKAAANGDFTSEKSKSSSSGFDAAELSPFGAPGPAKGAIFGGSVFGGGFQGGFSGGTKLSSFAAPTGDAKLGLGNGAVKPIGSPRRDIEEDDLDSDGGGEDVGQNEREEDEEEVDGRFQQQDVETGEDGENTIFASRASLYSFKGNAWKEGGKGTFKLNMAASSNGADSELNEPKTGRFIMRAHQTYRVLLNAPILKQMKVGDSKGNEPSGKSFSFMVVEDRKPTPYMVKLSDYSESKTLYHEVQKLQETLL